MDDAELDATIGRIGGRGLAIDGVHVSVHGRRSSERHWSPDIRRDIFSASKTFTSVAIGIAQGEGLLDVDDPVLRHLGHLTSTPAPGVDDVTIRQLLTMTSGIAYRWDDPDADHPADPATDILETRLGGEPGTAFNCRGADSYLLSRIVHACSGQDMRDHLLPRLFVPLRVANPQWLRCPRGYSLGAVGLHLRTEEFSRLGIALRDGGRYGERQILSADYVNAMTADVVPAAGHMATRASAPHRDNATLRPARLALRARRRLEDGRHLRPVQRRAAELWRVCDRHRPLGGVDHRHPRRHLVRHPPVRGLRWRLCW